MWKFKRTGEIEVGIILICMIFTPTFTYSDKEARSFPSGKETWGYVEARPGAHLFWWLYYTTSANPESAPLLLWLQGGPGASSTGFGNFMEIGPLTSSLKNRSSSWASHASILFIDSPVGAGFSYATDSSLFATNNSEIAADLLTTFSKFLLTVPDFQTVPLHIFSESYGGKMAALFALRLSKAVETGKVKCKLMSVNLGDSWISPVSSVLTWAPFLFSTSLLDYSGFEAVNKSAQKVKQALDLGLYQKATEQWDKTEQEIGKWTNGVNVYNILDNTGGGKAKGHSFQYYQHRSLKKFHADELSTLMNGPIRQKLSIIPANVTWGGQQQLVFNKLTGDFMKPVVNVVESLLNNTGVKVNVYSGQLDLIVDTMGTLEWVENLKWSDLEGWKKSPRKPVLIGGSTEMFVKTYKNFGFYWVLKAGHMVPADAPKTALSMMKLITNLATN